MAVWRSKPPNQMIRIDVSHGHHPSYNCIGTSNRTSTTLSKALGWPAGPAFPLSIVESSHDLLTPLLSPS